MYIVCIIARCAFNSTPTRPQATSRNTEFRLLTPKGVFIDPLAIHSPDPDAPDEDRFIAVGTGSVGVVMVVVYTLRGDEIRLISARCATRHEVRDYEG
ncbi:MAG: BrnT family toxin [Acidiferrobacter sp.]